jgi:hypothetical protein
MEWERWVECEGREEEEGGREERRKGRRSRGACRAKSSRLGDSVAWGTGGRQIVLYCSLTEGTDGLRRRGRVSGLSGCLGRQASQWRLQLGQLAGCELIGAVLTRLCLRRRSGWLASGSWAGAAAAREERGWLAETKHRRCSTHQRPHRITSPPRLSDRTSLPHFFWD